MIVDGVVDAVASVESFVALFSARATSSSAFFARALKLVRIARADARRAIRLRTSMASADDAAHSSLRFEMVSSTWVVCCSVACE